MTILKPVAVLAILGGFLLAYTTPAARADGTLVLYTYDSFAAKGGLGPAIFPLFEKKCGCKVRALVSGDVGQMLARLQLDSKRGSSEAQLIVGLDEPAFDRALPYLESWGAWTPQGLKKLRPEVLKARDASGAPNKFLPFDFSHFAFIADRQALREKGLEAPKRFSDLLKPEWKRRLILEDPRTSAPGLAFISYARAMSSAPDLWASLKSQWLTLAPGWDEAYGLFLKKEAPLVWSYVTSQAYHEDHGDKTGSDRRYAALTLEDGNPMVVESAALVRGVSKDPAKLKLAREFLEFLISPQAQALVPKHNWMYPARADAKLPPSFEHLPRPKKTIYLPSRASDVTAALGEWSKAVE